MTESDTSAMAPTGAGERYAIMDVLRGFALFGVLTANLVWLGSPGFMATGEAIEALPTAAADSVVEAFISLFVDDKANTLFAFLFGLGFWVQMERLLAKGAPFRSIYLRRITILLIVGFLHLFGLFAFDILHVYAIGGYILFFSRQLPIRTMLIIGAVLTIFGRPVMEFLTEAIGLSGPAFDIAYGDEATAARQAAAQAGNYREWIALMDQMVRYDWFASGLIFAWLTYVMGRFFLGAYVARKGWIQNAADHLPQFRKWLWPLLLGGLALQFLADMIGARVDDGEAVALLVLYEFLHAVATPLIVGGYICTLVTLFFSDKWAGYVRPFAPVGQMALTNYLTQSVVIMLVLTSIGPGLGLAGRAGMATFVPIAIAVFATQMIFSHFWMKRFAYGPAEWVWRTLTYGRAPAIRRRMEADYASNSASQ